VVNCGGSCLYCKLLLRKIKGRGKRGGWKGEKRGGGGNKKGKKKGREKKKTTLN